MEFKITKQLIARFKNPEINYRFVNGCKKTVSAIVEYSNGHRFEIHHEKVVQGLEEFTSKDRTYMLYPQTVNSGIVIDVPAELSFVVKSLDQFVQTTDLEAEEIKTNYTSDIKKIQI